MHTLKSRYLLSSVNKFSILSNCRIESLSLNQQTSAFYAVALAGDHGQENRLMIDKTKLMLHD